MGTAKRVDVRQTATETTAPSLATIGFLNVAGHELRAPVTALKGQLQLMQRRIRKEGGRARDDEALTKMLYQIERMQQLVAVYLDASYQERGELSLMRQPNNLVTLIERVVNLYAVASAKHPLRLETTETTLNGEFDGGRVDLVMRELLGNALKFAHEGAIVVRLRRDGDMAYIEVEDAGPTIPAERAEAVFDPYVTDAVLQNTGLGLGLFVAREDVRLHGGEMGLRQGERGNIFWFTLPLDDEAGDA
jgi:signal transduction histidine kinase